MTTSVFHLILFGFTYVILVYFIFTLLRKRRFNSGNEGNDDGGIEIFTPPKLDLPPGVSLPTGKGPGKKIGTEESEEILT
ncbi:hypothetical protein QQ020_26370 [Fulvivirgaceae bacterium BMA12]|uniref:Uncharacterized protein n=1 Tax=Agaribacillus aureus TaxID=3051825 RepID=A0ABT8LFU4_9BACT|nr:hypothetical protein [Fulvivirgaceae bacterium BMA12]